MVFLLYNWHMRQTEGKLLLMRKITVAGVKLVQGRTHLDDFSSSVCHGQWTSVQSRGGREEEQLAHLVHTTATHTHTTPFHMQKLSHKWRKTEKNDPK